MEQATLKTGSGGLGITLYKIPIKNNGDFYYCLLRDIGLADQ